MKVIVCGSREWTDRGSIEAVLSKLEADTIVLHGGCRGADALAGEVAEGLGFTVIEFPALWATEGKSAGPRRNVRMLGQRPDRVIAFHEDLDKSKGTKHMVSIARQAGVPVEVHSR